jgi:hypothetical protein
MLKQLLGSIPLGFAFKQHIHWQRVFRQKNCNIATASLTHTSLINQLTLDTSGGTTQIEMILFVSHCPR